MDKCREEFEEYFKEHHADSFYSVDVALEMRGDDYIDFLASDLWAIWQHQQAKVEELQKRLYGALKETQYALQYVEGDMRGNHEFLQMAMIRTFKALEQALKGEGL